MTNERQAAGDGGAIRAKYLTDSGAAGSEPAFTLTRRELALLVRDAVRDAQSPHNDTAGPALLDRNGLAAALGCSASQVDKLRQRGMPTVRLGDSPRFELEACLGWLRQKEAL